MMCDRSEDRIERERHHGRNSILDVHILKNTHTHQSF